MPEAYCISSFSTEQCCRLEVKLDLVENRLEYNLIQNDPYLSLPPFPHSGVHIHTTMGRHPCTLKALHALHHCCNDLAINLGFCISPSIEIGSLGDQVENWRTLRLAKDAGRIEANPYLC